MPISSSAQTSKHDIDLQHLTVNDHALLAKLISLILIGRLTHAEWIISGAEKPNPIPSKAQVQEAIRHLNCPIPTVKDEHGNDVPHSDVVHRDGWMLQLITWITHRKDFPDSLLKAPHSHAAGKGFDGLLIQLDNSTVEYIKLFEDKASDSPRAIVRVEVWPEFKSYESCERDGEMTAEASSLLKQVAELDVAELTATSDWYQMKRYCVSVATSKSKLPTRSEVFKGYEESIAGATDRRSARLLVVDDLRSEFKTIADATIAFLALMGTR